MHNRSARKQIVLLEDKVLDLTIQANHQDGEAKAATLEQLEAAKKTLDVVKWSYEMAPPSNVTNIRTT